MRHYRVTQRVNILAAKCYTNIFIPESKVVLPPQTLHNDTECVNTAKLTCRAAKVHYCGAQRVNTLSV